MFIDKRVDTKPEIKVTVDNDIRKNPRYTEEEAYEINALCDVYSAVKEILGTIKVDPNDPNSEPYFKTIKINNGQLSRIKNDKWNREYALAFPAAFIHFIDVRYLVQQSRIGEGRAFLRLQYVLNRLNNSDEEFEMEGYRLFQRINAALQSQKQNYPALTERFQLSYFDQPESFDDGLQPYWIDYEVWFKDYSGYRYKDYVDTYVVVPPFTNHSDQKPESNPNHHPDHDRPNIDDAVNIITP